jgi:hypothetical protein
VFNEPELVRYLLRKRLVTSKCIIEGDVRIADVSRRNRNFAVLTHNHSYLIKQARDSGCQNTIANEAALYSLFNSESMRGAESDAAHTLRNYLPHFFSYDDEEHALLLEFMSRARDLGEHQFRCGRFPCGIAGLIGHALSLLHRISYRNGIGEKDSFWQKAPWILTIHQPTVRQVASMTEGQVEVVKLLQNQEYAVLLEDLCSEWKATSLIHFDLKCDNLLVVASRKKTILKIIDWELAGWGDPSWDVGCIFGAYLGSWLFYIPIMTGIRADYSLELARYPIERLQPAIRAFWASYVRGMQLRAIEANQVLFKAVKYSAARLVQTAYEAMEAASQLTTSAVGALQVSMNILKRPRDAIRTLLGFSFK